MPAYDYRCSNKDCGHVQEETHSMSADPIIKCSECSTEMSRDISGGAAVHFKGDGFYATDYKDK
jgi:putative FmdB family regulatory protein